MNVFMLIALGLGAAALAAGTVWLFVRPASEETDMGSISRNWITEHRNDHE
jgi:hypothetical protein